MKSVDEPSKIPREIGNWIGSISELHRSKPPASVHYRSALRNNRMVWGPYGTLIGSVSSMLSCLQGTPQGPLHKKLPDKLRLSQTEEVARKAGRILEQCSMCASFHVKRHPRFIDNYIFLFHLNMG